MADRVCYIGAIVHYVLSNLDGTKTNQAGQHRPAIVVYCVPGSTGTAVQLQVFMDGTNDRQDGAGIVWVTSVPHDEEKKSNGTWHWPESA